MGSESSEILAKEMHCGPICDHCHMFLSEHADTFTGQSCDLQLAMNDLMRALIIAVIGERRYWKYKRRFEQLDAHPKGHQHD